MTDEEFLNYYRKKSRGPRRQFGIFKAHWFRLHFLMRNYEECAEISEWRYNIIPCDKWFLRELLKKIEEKKK